MHCVLQSAAQCRKCGFLSAWGDSVERVEDGLGVVGVGPCCPLLIQPATVKTKKCSIRAFTGRR